MINSEIKRTSQQANKQSQCLPRLFAYVLTCFKKMKIRKAVVPAAGYGTRFLPAVKSIPKEMLPVVDKPVIQYVVEELVASGIEQIILVTGWHKRAIEDHFDRHLELEYKLKESGKLQQLEEIKRLSDMAEFVYVRQKEQRGNGDAILTAENIVGDEPFVVVWGDDIVQSEPFRTKQLMDAYNQHQTIILSGTINDNPEDANKYAFAKGEKLEGNITRVEELIEKPGVDKKPSNLAVIGGCVLTPDIFRALREFKPEPGKELVYVDGINRLKNEGKEILALEIQNAKYYDCGNVAEYLKTNIAMAMKRPELKDKLLEYIKGIK